MIAFAKLKDNLTCKSLLIKSLLSLRVNTFNITNQKLIIMTIQTLIKKISPLVLCILFSTSLMYAQDEASSSTMNSIAVKISEGASGLEWMACPEFMGEGCNITVLQGDPSKGNFDILYKIPANHVVPKHWHTSPERIVVLSGTLEVTYDGEETQVLKQGDYAYGPAKKPHIAKSGSDGPCMLFIAFEEPMDAVEVKE